MKLKLSEGPAPGKRPLIIAFDAEWKRERELPELNDDDVDDESEDDIDPARNIILSYQYACRFLLDPGDDPAQEIEWSGIAYSRAAQALLNPHLSEEELAEIPERIKFADLLGQAITHGIELRKLRAWPTEVIAAGHWTRADLASMADYAEIKNQFDSVQKTYVSFEPYEARFTMPDRHVRKFKVWLIDTMLLSPAGNRRLDQLGQMYEFSKLETGTKEVDGKTIRYIEHMDQFLVDHPKEYEAYAIRDAEICALHLQEMAKFWQDDLKLDCGGILLTLGSTAVQFLLKHWADNGIELGMVNGFTSKKGKVFSNNTQKYYTKQFKVRKSKIAVHQTLAALASYGGRNEAFWVGATPAGDFREFDITGAYTTALSSIRMFDYDNIRVSNDPADYTPDQAGFALVRFKFPVGCHYPCLPVKADNQRGLIYTMSDETYATSPEIAAARHLGAEVEIVHGIVIPWMPTGPLPYQSVLVEFARRRAQHPDGSLQNKMYKELGNCLYGKTFQGTKDKKAYNTRTDKHEPIGESPITNIFVAAYVTGLIRALLGELIAGIPPHYIVVSATTDSIITNCPQEEIPLTGPVASYLAEVRAQLAAADPSGRTKGALIDVKSHTRRLLSWRTRGIATLESIPNQPIKLAKGGIKTDQPSLLAANDWLVEKFLTNKPLRKLKSRSQPSFTDAHRGALDHSDRIVKKTANFEYDHKRRIVSPEGICVPIPGENKSVEILGAATEPWQTVAEFNAYRELFEQWRFSGTGHRLKTMEDWRVWQEFVAGDSASRAGVRRSKDGVVQQALRIFWKAYAKQLWGLPGKSYHEAAERLTAAGYPTKEQSFKNTLRDRKPPPASTIPAEAPGVRDLVVALLAIWPSFEWNRLVRDVPEGWLDPQEPPAHLPQMASMREVKPPREPQETWKVSLLGMMHRSGRPNLKLLPEDPVPLQTVAKPRRGLHDRRDI